MVLYGYESNPILTDPFKNHTTQELVRVQTRLIQYLLDWGLKPTALHIDRKCLKAFQSLFRENIVDVQICPTNDHYTN